MQKDIARIREETVTKPGIRCATNLAWSVLDLKVFRQHYGEHDHTEVTFRVLKFDRIPVETIKVPFSLPHDRLASRFALLRRSCHSALHS
jgi:hypothetical protein